VVVDGVEPVGPAGESIQLELFEYLYHQVLRKDCQWVARDLFRQHYREHAESAAAHAYPAHEIGCMLLLTAQETGLEELLARPLEEGDLLATANTVIYLGKLREGTRLRRAMYVAKNRGGPCPDEILPFRIDEKGIRLQ
jgi:hypothetical protein